MNFDMFFGILIFEQKWGFCMGYSLCIMADFENALISPIFSVFLGAVFCREQLWMICRMDFEMCFGIKIFEPNWGFFVGYSLSMMADFENAVISRIFGVFSSGFLQRTTVNDF